MTTGLLLLLLHCACLFHDFCMFLNSLVFKTIHKNDLYRQKTYSSFFKCNIKETPSAKKQPIVMKFFNSFVFFLHFFYFYIFLFHFSTTTLYNTHNILVVCSQNHTKYHFVAQLCTKKKTKNIVWIVSKKNYSENYGKHTLWNRKLLLKNIKGRYWSE